MVRKIKDKKKAKQKKLIAKMEKQENKNKTILDIPKTKKRLGLDKVTKIIILISVLMIAGILFANNFLDKHKKSPVTTTQNTVVKQATDEKAPVLTTNGKTIKVDANGVVEKIKTEVKKEVKK